MLIIEILNKPPWISLNIETYYNTKRIHSALG